MSENYEWNGISVYPLNGANKRMNQLFLTNKAINSAIKIQKEKPVDVVHSFWLHRATEIASKVSKSLRVPMLATAMGQEMRNPKRSFAKWKDADFPIVSISEFQSDALKAKGVIPTAVIPWGIDQPVRKEKDVDLICVGSLIPLKNTTYFIDLCAKMRAESEEFRAIVIGEGPDREALEDQIQSNNLKSNIQLLGAMTYEETQSWIAQSKVLVHASDFEGFGMTIIEALANETHVLATPVGIARDLEVPHLIGDPQLDVAMLRMLLKSDHPEGQLFSISETVKAYQTIYESGSNGKAIGS